MSAHVCNLAAWFGAPDVGYQPYYGRRKRKPVGPIRVQLSRKKGWRMPPNTVKVCRPGKWGNPFKVAVYAGYGARDAARDYRLWVDGALTAHSVYEVSGRRGDYQLKPPTVDEIRRELRGKNLACWCRPGKPCHADVLLEIANS